jgi:hypothetical protein
MYYLIDRWGVDKLSRVHSTPLLFHFLKSIVVIKYSGFTLCLLLFLHCKSATIGHAPSASTPPAFLSAIQIAMQLQLWGAC